MSPEHAKHELAEAQRQHRERKHVEAVAKEKIEAEKFAREEAEMLEVVPLEFRSALSSKAWEDGHASGFNEVLSILDDLISTFEKPIKEFEKRIRAEAAKPS